MNSALSIDDVYFAHLATKATLDGSVHDVEIKAPLKKVLKYLYIYVCINFIYFYNWHKNIVNKMYVENLYTEFVA